MREARAQVGQQVGHAGGGAHLDYDNLEIVGHQAVEHGSQIEDGYVDLGLRIGRKYDG
jgi:hypothetical protein